jgi:hypothetical protein
MLRWLGVPAWRLPSRWRLGEGSVAGAFSDLRGGSPNMISGEGAHSADAAMTFQSGDPGCTMPPIALELARAGAAADLIAVDGDPLMDVGVLARPTLVVSRGKIIVDTPAPSRSLRGDGPW